MRLKTPFSGLCLPDLWYEPHQFAIFQYEPQICPDVLYVHARRDSNGLPIRTFVNIASRGWASPNGACGGSDDYFTPGSGVPANTAPSLPDGGAILIWLAHLDAIWASSVTIEVTALDNSGPSAATIYVHRFNTLTGEVTKSITSDDGAGGLNCSGSTKATITVNDDGTFSIA